MTAEATAQLDPQSLVARILVELEANPAAQHMLLRALLTNEFLGMPARLDAVEKDVAEMKIDIAALKADVAELKVDVAQLKVDVAELKVDVAQLKVDVAELKVDVRVMKDDIATLKGSDLENRLHRNIRSIISQNLDLIRPRTMQSPLQEPINEFADQVYDTYREGRITREQHRRIEQTDFILRALSAESHAPLLVAVEASATVDAHDIERARESADALATVFGLETIAVVAGYRIDPRDSARAEAEDVRYVPAH